jgi:hypothetical protein
MNAYPHNRRAETAGRWLGGTVRRLTFRDGRVTRVGHLPIVARVVLWTVGFVAVTLLVVIAFWFALLVGVMLILAMVLPHISRSSDDVEPEWRQGVRGFGLYDANEFRIDPHDPDDEQ